MMVRTMAPELERHLAAIPDLRRRYGVTRLDVFGSAATGAFDPARSDFDFLVEFDADSSGLFSRYFGLKESLGALLGRPVDPVTTGALADPYIVRAVEETRRALYVTEDAQAS